MLDELTNNVTPSVGERQCGTHRLSPTQPSLILESSEESLRENTGRGWTEWRELIDAMLDDQKDHPSVASWLASEHALDGWWAQAVTVGWERLSGRREKYQMADGTYRPSRTRVVGNRRCRLTFWVAQ